MIKSAEKLKQLASVLNGTDNLLISEAIVQLREEHPFEGVIGLLVACYNTNNDRQVRRSIEGFMNDLKDKSVRTEVIGEIRKSWSPATLSMLVSSCWQSGLDYSEYYADIVKLFLDGDFATAIECLTLIQESLHNLSGKNKADIARMVEENIPASSEEKAMLKYELLTIISE